MKIRGVAMQTWGTFILVSFSPTMASLGPTVTSPWRKSCSSGDPRWTYHPNNWWVEEGSESACMRTTNACFELCEAKYHASRRRDKKCGSGRNEKLWLHETCIINPPLASGAFLLLLIRLSGEFWREKKFFFSPNVWELGRKAWYVCIIKIH